MNSENIKSPYQKFMDGGEIRLTIEGGPEIVIDTVGFRYNGRLVEDEGEVHGLFREWLLLAHKVDQKVMKGEE